MSSVNVKMIEQVTQILHCGGRTALARTVCRSAEAALVPDDDLILACECRHLLIPNAAVAPQPDVYENTATLQVGIFPDLAIDLKQVFTTP